MRVAVVGGGISGLVCAYRLRDAHDVVLFESKADPGGHTWTVDVERDDGHWAVDTGFIVYNERTYPRFISLLSELGIEGQPTNMSFSVHDPVGQVEYCSRGLPGIFAQRRNLLRPSHYGMVRDILRFNREAPGLISNPSGISLMDYVHQQGYSPIFIRRYLLPMCAAIWSASLEEAGQFPADHFVDFFHNHGLLSVGGQPQWFVVPGGSREYVKRMVKSLGDRVRCNQSVLSVKRDAHGVTVRTASDKQEFDQVIFACHSDEALGLLADPSEREAEILGGLPYQANDVILHTDASVLPATQRAWASWNYRIDEDARKPATLTYHMNALQGLQAPVEFCVTLNQREAIRPETIVGEYTYAHPVYTLAADAYRARRAEINGQNRSWYCGAYWYHGFHEDGVHSAMDVVTALETAA